MVLEVLLEVVEVVAVKVPTHWKMLLHLMFQSCPEVQSHRRNLQQLPGLEVAYQGSGLMHPQLVLPDLSCAAR